MVWTITILTFVASPDRRRRHILCSESDRSRCRQPAFAIIQYCGSAAKKKQNLQRSRKNASAIRSLPSASWEVLPRRGRQRMNC